MCRLYGFRATHPVRLDCELYEAQNALLRQAGCDARGLSNPDGWGIAAYYDGQLRHERQPNPADRSAAFRTKAMKVDAKLAIAHVRRATVGTTCLENTHPFCCGNALLAHNGHVGAFDRVGPRIREAMAPSNRDAIIGTTDSEHVFQLLLSRLDTEEPTPEQMSEVLAETIRDVVGWARDEGANAALNILWIVGDALVASRVGRTLYYVHRDRPHWCGEMEPPDFDEEACPDFCSVALASEPITMEPWFEVPDDTVVCVGSDTSIDFVPIF